ncbi:MAG: MAPEG family protein [Porticoccaceae bacterium]|jgi:glutathione S-transferase|nr:MAPEG family protein [Porticoccaceae bacterium]
MENTLIVILVALLQYIIFTMKVGATRGKYDVSAPKTVGNDLWERLYRIQQNTMEQLINFFPAMVIFTLYVSEIWPLLPGILFLVGRQLYAGLYFKDPTNSGPGEALSFFSNLGVVIASLAGLVMQVLS